MDHLSFDVLCDVAKLTAWLPAFPAWFEATSNTHVAFQQVLPRKHSLFLFSNIPLSTCRRIQFCKDGRYKNWRHGSRTFLHGGAFFGNPHVCLWCVTCFGSTVEDATEALCWSARSGHLAMCQWLTDYFDLTRTACKIPRKDACEPFNVITALEWAAEYGHLRVCRWLINRFQLTPTIIQSSTAFYNAASKGQLAVCKWLVTQSGLTMEDVRPERNAAFHCAAIGGHLNVCKWLAKRVGFNDIRGNNNCVLRKAASHGHLKLLQWLVGYFRLTATDARSIDNDALRSAAVLGHLDVCKWLTKWFNLTAQDARAKNNYALHYAATNGHLHVCQWLVQHFGLDVTDTQTVNNNTAIQEAINDNLRGGLYIHPGVRAWFEERFGIIVEDIPSPRLLRQTQ